MDQMIETRIFLPSNTEEDALKLFAQNRMLMKRGVLNQQKAAVSEKEMRAMRKKVALLELSIHSLKHKLKDVERFAKTNIENAVEKVEK